MTPVGRILYQNGRLYKAVMKGNCWNSRDLEYLKGIAEWWDRTWQFAEFKSKLSSIGLDSKLDRTTLKELVFSRFQLNQDRVSKESIKYGSIGSIRNFIYNTRPFIVHCGIPILRTHAYGLLGRSRFFDEVTGCPLTDAFVVGRSDARLFDYRWDLDLEYYKVSIKGPVIPDEQRVQPSLRRAKLVANKISPHVGDWDAYKIIAGSRPDLFKRPNQRARYLRVPEDDLRILRMLAVE